MKVFTNVASLVARENSILTDKRVTSSLDKLSTGFSINKASDDASGLSISEKLKTQATSIRQSIDNGNSAIAMLQIADKSMSEQSKILDKVKSKLIQANTDTTSADGRAAIKKDIDKLLEQLDNIARNTNYNETQLLSNYELTSSANSLSFQIGENANSLISASEIESNNNFLGAEYTEIRTSGGLQTTTTSNTTNYNLTTQVLNTGNPTMSDIKTTGSNFNLTFTKTTVSEDEITVTGKGGVLTTGAGQITIVVNKNTDIDSKIAETLTPVSSTATQNNYVLNPPNSLNLGDTSFTNLILNHKIATTSTFTGTDVTAIQHTFGNDDLTVSGTYDIVRTTTITEYVEESVERIKASGTNGNTLSDLKAITSNQFSKTHASEYQDTLDRALTQVNGFRAEIGSTINQIESALRNQSTQYTSIQAAESIIRDVDYTKESANFNKESLISQAGSYSLSQANKIQNSVISLFN